MASEKKIQLQFVVNGNPVTVEANIQEPLKALLVSTLKKAGVAGEPEPDRWIFKDQSGNVLDKNKDVGDFGFAAEATIFLSLEAGIAGYLNCG